ncbi:MAG: hypothetical protein J4F49_13590, partial [Rhodobacteraceae bacterium]|nr:hypothetical protein [Paracoccaceae bacterium]
MNLDSFISIVLGRRWLTILVGSIVVCALAAGMMFIVTVEVDVRNHFSEGDPRIAALDRLENTYSLTDTALVAVAPQDNTIFTQDNLATIEELTEQLWLTPYVSRVDSIANYSHSEGFEDELIVQPLVDSAGSLDDNDIERIEKIALTTEEIAGR